MKAIRRELPSGSSERKGLLFTSIDEVSMTTATRIHAVDRTGHLINVGDDVRYILDGAPFRDEDSLRGRVFNSKNGSLLVHWSDGSESVVTAADVRDSIVLVKSRS